MNKIRPSSALTDAERAVLRVAYHDGPPEITFYGINWRRGEAQVVTDEAWAVMQARGDFKEFDFRAEGAAEDTVSTHDSRLTTHGLSEE